MSPFLMLGDPTASLSLALAKGVIADGATMLELGIPFGDPCADGPTIQAAHQRALASGTTTARALEMVADIRRFAPEVPLNLLVYGNIAHARGFDRFCADAALAGASSLLAPDISLEESKPLRDACAKASLGYCALVGPQTDADRLRAIARDVTAFVYLVAHQGVTGVRKAPAEELRAATLRVSREIDVPICVGFGLSTPEHVRAVFAGGGTVAVVASYLVDAIARAWNLEGDDRELRVAEQFRERARPLVTTGDLTCL